MKVEPFSCLVIGVVYLQSKTTSKRRYAARISSVSAIISNVVYIGIRVFYARISATEHFTQNITQKNTIVPILVELTPQEYDKRAIEVGDCILLKSPELFLADNRFDFRPIVKVKKGEWKCKYNVKMVYSVLFPSCGVRVPITFDKDYSLENRKHPNECWKFSSIQKISRIANPSEYSQLTALAGDRRVVHFLFFDRVVTRKLAYLDLAYNAKRNVWEVVVSGIAPLESDNRRKEAK